jgi:hypothetical protein
MASKLALIDFILLLFEIKFLSNNGLFAAAAIRLRLRLLQYFSLYGLQLQQSKQLQQCRLVASRTRPKLVVGAGNALVSMEGLPNKLSSKACTLSKSKLHIHRMGVIRPGA